jgi:hypothetical protein
MAKSSMYLIYDPNTSREKLCCVWGLRFLWPWLLTLRSAVWRRVFYYNEDEGSTPLRDIFPYIPNPCPYHWTHFHRISCRSTELHWPVLQRFPWARLRWLGVQIRWPSSHSAQVFCLSRACETSRKFSNNSSPPQISAESRGKWNSITFNHNMIK